jgi:hypothetical protein
MAYTSFLSSSVAPIGIHFLSEAGLSMIRTLLGLFSLSFPLLLLRSEELTKLPRYGYLSNVRIPFGVSFLLLVLLRQSEELVARLN